MLYGIEQEIPLLRDNGKSFADFTNTDHKQLQVIIDKLPLYQGDYPILRVGDLGIKQKRWYVEGYERFDESGKFIKSIPKSFEIRTLPHDSIGGALTELSESYKKIVEFLGPSGFLPTWISFNPIHGLFTPEPPLNSFEQKMRLGSPEAQTANIAQLTFGPDLSISSPDFNDKDLIDIGKKLTYYSPFIIPFSFSSPFTEGKLWAGLSHRTYLRTGARPAVMVFLHDKKYNIESRPSLTQESRVPAERGRIEFKAFDTCCDLDLYRALFILIEGIIKDTVLPGRALVPDKNMHQKSAMFGFSNTAIAETAREVIKRARQVLPNSPDSHLFDKLEDMTATNNLPVYSLINSYKETNSVIETLKQFKNLNI